MVMMTRLGGGEHRFFDALALKFLHVSYPAEAMFSAQAFPGYKSSDPIGNVFGSILYSLILGCLFIVNPKIYLMRRDAHVPLTSYVKTPRRNFEWTQEK